MGEKGKTVTIWILGILVIALIATVVILTTTIINNENEQKIANQVQSEKTEIKNEDITNVVELSTSKEENQTINTNTKNNIIQLTQAELIEIQEKLNGSLFLVNIFEKPEDENTLCVLSSFESIPGITRRVADNMSEEEIIEITAYIYEENYPEILNEENLSNEQKHLKIVEKIKEDETYFMGSPKFELKVPYNVAKDYLMKNLVITEQQACDMLEKLKDVALANYIEETNCFYIATQGPVPAPEDIKCIEGTLNTNGLYTIEYTTEFHPQFSLKSYITSFYINDGVYQFFSNVEK